MLKPLPETGDGCEKHYRLQLWGRFYERCYWVSSRGGCLGAGGRPSHPQQHLPHACCAQAAKIHLYVLLSAAASILFWLRSSAVLVLGGVWGVGRFLFFSLFNLDISLETKGANKSCKV